MYAIDIASLVREALVLSGCTEQQVGQFDGHSTIELEFTDLPNLNIAVLDSGAWFWSPVVELSPAAQAHYAPALLNFLMQGFPPARTEQLQLNRIGDMLEVRVLLSEASVASPSAMAEAIEAYVERLDALQDVLR